ncbi:MAG: HesA/MoeB/ThiF family protein [Oligoflexia bacterium]|nr:HesA/MoeB/ThiF family protein [Oligoflexia bacterium]
MQRYHRQTILPQIGVDGQKILHKSKVLIIGAGGLGHPAIQYLAAMGVGEIKIIDGDSVHVTNLPRQILFSDQDIGGNKAEILSRKIGRIYSNLNISFESVFLEKSLALKLFPDFDLIIDCTDNFESKFLINDVCVLYDKPMIYGAISQFEGQVGIFWKSRGACYRCLYPSIPKSTIQNCAEAGVVGPVAGTIGSLQAVEAMKILINKFDKLKPLIGRVNFYNFSDHSFRSLDIPRRQTCLCHAPNFKKENIIEVKRAECKVGGSVLLVDVREKDEWHEFHIKDSINFPLSKLESGLAPEFALNQEVILICKASMRAKRAKELLTGMNFKNIQCSDKGVYEYQTR